MQATTSYAGELGEMFPTAPEPGKEIEPYEPFSSPREVFQRVRKTIAKKKYCEGWSEHSIYDDEPLPAGSGSGWGIGDVAGRLEALLGVLKDDKQFNHSTSRIARDKEVYGFVVRKYLEGKVSEEDVVGVLAEIFDKGIELNEIFEKIIKRDTTTYGQEKAFTYVLHNGLLRRYRPFLEASPKKIAEHEDFLMKDPAVRLCLQGVLTRN